jgi:hypothetical protein
VSEWLKISILVNLFLVSVTCYLDWWGGYDGLNFFVLPFWCPAMVLIPVNVVWTLVFMIKAKDKEVTSNAVWIVLAFLPIAAFFLPRFPR